MHIKTTAAAAKVFTEMKSQSRPVSNETFFSSPIRDVFLFYLDLLQGSSINTDDHSIFTTLTKKYEDRFMHDIRNLNVLDPHELARVTEYGPKIVHFVDEISENTCLYYH